MAKINCVWAAVLLFTVCKAQFFYNDDEQPAYQQPRDNEYEYDRSPPAARTDPEPANHQPAPPAPPVRVPEYEHRPEPSRARRSGSGHRPRQPPPQRPRVYSPSVFENLAVGKAPPGVSIPEDSFLNILTNGGRSTHARQSPVYEPPPPQQTSFVHPPSAQPRSPPRYAQSPAYEPSPPQQTSFVQPPPAQPRSPPAYEQSPPPVRARAPVTDNRRYPTGLAPPPPPRVQSRASPPAVHNLPHAEGAQPEPIENPVQYRAPAVPVQPSPQHSNRRRSGVRLRQITPSRSSWNLADEERQRPRRVFSPSVFENLGPGIAPSGVHVPEDSFLNILRNDRHISRTRRDQDYELGPPDEPVPQYAPVQYSAEPRSSARDLPTDYELPQKVQSVQPAPRRVAPQPQPPSPQQEFVDNTAHHQTTEQRPRVTQQRKPVQSRRRVSVRRHRQYSSSIPDSDPNEEEIYRQPKQFAPSVFEKFELGEAPPGIHVPEDSILNLLRGDRPATRARSSQSPPRQRPHAPQYVPPPEAEPVVSEDAYEGQNRRSPPQRHQSTPVQDYHTANAQPPREIRRPIEQEAPQPAVAPRVAQPPKRQRHRSQPVHAPQPQPVYEVPNAVYNAPSHLQEEEEEDILRYRSQNNNQRTRQQEQAPQRKRGNTAPRYIPPPQQQEPVYEAPQPSYDDSSNFQQPEDIPRRRSPPRNQRPTQVQQPVQRPRADSQSRRPPPSQPRYVRNDEVPETRQQSQFKAAKLSVKPLPDDVDGDQIPGEAGIDYPTFHVIPSTSFSCGQQRHNGYYADVETSCQVMHLCQSGGVQSSFLCPNGTIFSQEKFSCQWWYKVNCADAPSHYGVNDKLYKVPPRPSRRNRE